MVCALFVTPTQTMQGSQTLEVCIRLDTSEKAIAACDIDSYVREQCQLFGILGRATSAEKYIPVISALCMDSVDRFDCVQLQKDLVTNIPYMIQRDLVNVPQKKQVEGIQKYSFPRYVPQSFVEKIRKYPVFSHQLYQNKKSTLIVKYAVQQLREKIHKAPSTSLTKEITTHRKTYKISSFFNIPGISKLGFFTFLLLLVVRG